MKKEELSIILLYTSLWLFVSIIIAKFVTIPEVYNFITRDGDWPVILISITWTIYCFCSGYLKYKNIQINNILIENLNNDNILLRKSSEYILCSAIWFDDGVDTYVHQPKNIKTGFVVCGRRHHNCFTIVAMLIGIRKERLTKDEIQGFLTNKDRFVDRYEAAKIALASGQIKEPKERLFSEDVW